MPRFASTSAGSSGGGTNPAYFFNPSGTFGTCVTFYTQSGCFIVPNGISSVRARVWGAGGGAQVINGNLAGGGGGGFALRTITGLTAGTCIPVTVGAFNQSFPGGTSSFGSFVSATGGACNAVGAISLGGTGVGGDINRCGGFSCNTQGCAAGGGGSGNYFGNGGCFLACAFSGSSGAGACFGTVPCTPGGNGLTGVGSLCCCNASSANLLAPWTYLDYYGTGPGGGGCACGFNGGGNGARCNTPGFGGSPNPIDNVTGLVIVEF